MNIVYNKTDKLDMCYSVHFRKVFIETPTNAPLVYYTIINCVIV
jgi:hypothetical protein